VAIEHPLLTGCGAVPAIIVELVVRYEIKEVLLKREHFEKLAKHVYEQYKRECQEAPAWVDLHQEQRDGFTAAAVHSAACIFEVAENKKVKRFILEI
jgi:hypothetical protein